MNSMSKSAAGNKANKLPLYEEHLPRELLEELVAAGKAVIGKLKVIPTMRKKGFVECEGLDRDILIEDERWRNRAFIGDIVVVEILQDDHFEDFSSTLSTATASASGGGMAILGKSSTTTSCAVNESSVDALKLPSNGDKDDDLERTEKLWKPNHELLEKFNMIPVPVVVSKTCEDINRRYANSRLANPKGKVIGILESNHLKTLVGKIYPMIEVAPGSKLPANQVKVYFEPNNKSYPNLILLRDDLPEAYIADPNAMTTKIFTVDLDPLWLVESKLPLGMNARSLGEMGFIHAETEALLVENNLPHCEFTQSMMASLESILGVSGLEPSTRVVDWNIPADEISRRLDLRHKRIFTIDPTSAKDLDDAMHVEPMEDGTFEIGVHIADVSYFLREHNELDDEARNRATSVYLVQKVLPMLPPLLSENLCSLNPNVDRLAFSCIWKMNADGTISDEEPYFGRTVIRSCAKLDYITAQRMIDGLIPDHPYSSEDPDFEIKSLAEEIWNASRKPANHFGWECCRDVKLLNSIAVNRRNTRLAKGSLLINTDKLTFSLDSDGNPTTVGKYLIRKSNNLIEEYMLLANYFVAEKLIECVGGAAFIRSHESPDLETLRSNLEEYMVQSGIPISFDGGLSDFKETMLEVTKADQITRSCIGALMTRALPRAQYLTAFSKSSSSWKHYGLNIPYYTHFTSPIRRYADVIVHRLLDLSISASSSPQKEVIKNEEYLRTSQSIALHCNDMKNASRNAQLRSDAVFLSIYLINNPQIVSGKVVGVAEKYFWVYDNKYGVMKRIFCDSIPGVDVSYNELNNTLVLTGRSSNNNNYNIYSSSSSSSSSGGVGPESTDIACELEQESITIGMMCGVKLRLTSSKAPPIDVVVSILNSDWNNEPLRRELLNLDEQDRPNEDRGSGGGGGRGVLVREAQFDV